MSTIPVTKTFVLSPIELAAQIEGVFNKALLPYERGIYIGESFDPILRTDKQYFKKVPGKGKVYCLEPIKDSSEISGDIYDAEGEIIVRCSERARLSLTPALPVRGLKIITAYLEDTVIRNSIWAKNGSGLDDKLKILFKPEFCDMNKLHVDLDNLLVDICNSVSEFIGNDKWMMYFVKIKGSDILIEKTIDYRIYDWMNRTKNGTWV